jgi:hypothetical protein
MKPSYMRALGVLVAGLACVPTVAFAQAESMMPMRVERTMAYVVVLSIGPAETMAPSMGMGTGQTGEMSMSHGQSSDMSMGHDTGMMAPEPMMADMGMAVNHHLDIHVTSADTGAPVTSLTPTIRITDKATGESRDLPEIMSMAGGMGPNDWVYGQNVFLPDGTFQVTVQLGPSDTAVFRDVTVEASPMMAEPGMGHDTGMSHDMGTPTQMAPHP